MNGPENYARATPLQVALREIRATASAPRFWVGMGAMIAILAVAAPFNTGDSLSLSGLIVYWGLMAVCTFFIAMPVSAFVSAWCFQRGMPHGLSWFTGGMVCSVPVFAFVLAVNTWLFRFPQNEALPLLTFYIYVLAISVAVSVIYYLAHNRPGEQASAPVPVASSPSPFFDRLPKSLGTDIISLQAQDHYLKVTTTAGAEMILLRLTDAEKELAEYDGLRVHRSWWVANKHIAQMKRDGDRVFLKMENGDEIPVSRSYAKAVREALGK